MRSKSYLLHVYKDEIYQESIVFDSRTKLTSHLRSSGGVFGTDLLTGIGDRLVTVPSQTCYRFEIEELVC